MNRRDFIQSVGVGVGMLIVPPAPVFEPKFYEANVLLDRSYLKSCVLDCEGPVFFLFGEGIYEHKKG